MPTFDYINQNFISHNTKLQYTKVAALLSVTQQLTPKRTDCNTIYKMQSKCL